ncbi:MAG: hypothetical protein LIP08_13245 [Bacteroides sp.]|nr:hypothetical protein [Bacteroides sp.]
MKILIDKLMETVGVWLPFLRRKDARKVKEFTDLVMSQYQFLATELDKMLKDYLGLAELMKKLHSEMRHLNTQLMEADLLKCLTTDCTRRQARHEKRQDTGKQDGTCRYVPSIHRAGGDQTRIHPVTPPNL